MVQGSVYVGIAGLLFTFAVFRFVKRQPAGNSLMQRISYDIHQGAMAFLKQEYTFLLLFISVVFFLLYQYLQPETAYAFLLGAGCSMAAGFIGMQSATMSNVRTTQAALDQGINAALKVAFSGGAVMGLAVASLGLAGVGYLFNLYADNLSQIPYLLHKNAILQAIEP